MVSSAGPRLGALTVHLSPFPRRPVSIVAPRVLVGPASLTVYFCVLTAPECIAPWVSISALSGRFCVRVLCVHGGCTCGQRRGEDAWTWTFLNSVFGFLLAGVVVVYSGGLRAAGGFCLRGSQHQFEGEVRCIDLVIAERLAQ